MILIMKTLKIVQLVLWLLIIALLVTVLFGFAFGKWNFSSFFKTEKQVELLQQSVKMEDINDIKIDIQSADIVIKPSDNNEIGINYRGPESLLNKLDITVTVNNGQLSVVQKNDFPFHFFVFGNFTPRVLTISLPESYSKNIDLKNTSGDLTITGNYSLNDFRSHTTSGDSNISTLTCTNFSLDSTSGDITLGDINSQKTNISLTSGQIKADTLTGDGNITCSSGTIQLGSLTGKSNISTTSGDISVLSFSGSGSISCTSGDITLTSTKSTGDLSVKTFSGSVVLAIGKDASYDIEAICTSGDISSDFPLSFSDSGKSVGGQVGSGTFSHLSVHTTSGDIHFKN